MFSADYIQGNANKSSYTKGVDLYNKDKVLSFNYETHGQGDTDLISAKVEGSGHNIYDVEIMCSRRMGMVFAHHCDCPANYKYAKYCKHVVAVLLEYAEAIASEEVSRDDEPYADTYDVISAEHSENLERDPWTKRTPETRKTLWEVSRLLKSDDAYQFSPIFTKVSTTKVKLEPVVSVFPDGFELSFKIGAERMYVLKDLPEFCENMSREAYHSYGKNLAFHHTLQAIEEGSQGLVKFLMAYFKKERRYYYSATEKRYLDFDTDDFVAFLQKTGVDKIAITSDYNYDSGVYSITDEKMPRAMRIKKFKEGLELSIDFLTGLVGERHYVYFAKDILYIVEVRKIKPIQEFLTVMARQNDRKIFIAQEDVERFQKHLLPKLRAHYTIDMPEMLFEVQETKVPPTFSIYLDLPEKNLVTCQVKVSYGDKQMYLFEDVHRDIRDSALERKVNKGISAYFVDYDSVSHELYHDGSEEGLYRLLTEGLSELASYGEIFISDKLKKINVVKHTPVTVGVKVDNGLLDLTLKNDGLSPSQLAEILMQYNPKKRYYRLKNGDFIDVKDSELESLHELSEGLNLTEKQLGESNIHVPKYRALFIDEQLKKGHGGVVHRDKDFKALIRNMKTVEENDFDVPEPLEDILRSYQKSGFLWMKTLKSNGFGGILADDMGLGKTLQVIAFLKSEGEGASTSKTLIVSPSSLVYNWQREFEKFAPDMPVTTITGKPSEREKIIREAKEGAILITSYDLLKRDAQRYEGTTFGYQIIDEAQYIKNTNTKAAKAVKGIQADFKLALTGTPIENRLSELWSIFDYLMPGFLYSYKKFKSDIEVAMVKGEDKHVANRLRKMVSPFVLRRLKADVLADLPDKIEEDIVVPMEKEQRQVYDARVAQLKMDIKEQSPDAFRTSKLKVLAELTRLRQLCCDPGLVYENYDAGSAKVDICMDLLQEAVDGGHKVLLFSQFTSNFERLAPLLRERAITSFTLTGSTSKEKRMALVDRFNNDDTSVFCISLKAGGTGLNLTSADIVIHFDSWWNVAAQNQATDRAHRIGQKSVVNVYKLIAKDTIEEKILGMQQRKQALADEVLSGEGIGKAAFSKEELMEILG